jgi:hypothetical protein
MKSVLSVVTFVFLTLNVISQSSFSYLVSTPDHEKIFNGAEDELGNYYMIGSKVRLEPLSQSAWLLVLDYEGQLVYEHKFYVEDTSSYFGYVFYKNDSIIIFGAKGSSADDMVNNLWMLVLNTDFNILKSKTFKLDNTIGDIEPIINTKGNYVICGDVVLPDPVNPTTDIFLYEISPLGDSVNYKVLPLTGREMEFDLIEKSDGGYKVFAYGNFPGAPNTSGTIVEFDSSFNYLSGDSIPYGLMFQHSACWLNDSIYLVTGYKPIYNPFHEREDAGIAKLSAENDFIAGNHFGKTGDTITYVGATTNLDFLVPESIFFGGSSDVHPQNGVWQADSWLILNNLDPDLNLNWQKFYGGDGAGYFLWGLLATHDGGCLMMSTRYDETIQVNELDVFILKVDSNGLLTTVGDGPVIPVQQLAIFPNPARDFISIRYPDIFGNDEKEIIIFNSLGNEVKHISATENLTETHVNISGLPTGLYFTVLKVEGEKVATGKFLVVR